MTTTPRVATAHEWAEYMQGEVVQLSRFAVVVKRVDPFDMMTKDGSIPGVLAKLEQSGQEIGAGNAEEIVKMLPDLKPILKHVALAAVVEPVLVDGDAFDLDKGEIPVQWLTTTDRLLIFQMAFGEAAVLAARFPGEPDGSVAAVDDLDGIRAAARDAGGADGDG